MRHDIEFNVHLFGLKCGETLVYYVRNSFKSDWVHTICVNHIFRAGRDADIVLDINLVALGQEGSHAAAIVEHVVVEKSIVGCQIVGVKIVLRAEIVEEVHLLVVRYDIECI